MKKLVLILAVGISAAMMYSCEKDEFSPDSSNKSNEKVEVKLKKSLVSPVINYGARFNFHRPKVNCVSGFSICRLKPYIDYNPLEGYMAPGGLSDPYDENGQSFINLFLYEQPSDVEPYFFGINEDPFVFSTEMCTLMGITSLEITPDNYIWHSAPLTATDQNGNSISVPFGYIKLKVNVI